MPYVEAILAFCDLSAITSKPFKQIIKNLTFKAKL